MKKFLLACGVFAMIASLSSCCGNSCETASNEGFNDSATVYLARVSGANLSQQIKRDPNGEKINKRQLLKAFKYVMLSDTANVGLSVGLQVGMYFNSQLMQLSQGVEFDRALFVKEFEKALLADSIDNPEKTGHILDSLLNKAQDIAREKQRVALEENPVAIQNAITGRAFMDKIKQEEGVVTTESGLAYKVVKAGNGPCPETTDRVTVKYKGMLIDESVFDENAEGVEFPVTGVIPGFSEGLKLMSKGSIYRLYIPTELAYGINGPQTIGPNQTLIFDVELIDIKK